MGNRNVIHDCTGMRIIVVQDTSRDSMRKGI